MKTNSIDITEDYRRLKKETARGTNQNERSPICFEPMIDTFPLLLSVSMKRRGPRRSQRRGGPQRNYGFRLSLHSSGTRVSLIYPCLRSVPVGHEKRYSIYPRDEPREAFNYRLANDARVPLFISLPVC